MNKTKLKELIDFDIERDILQVLFEGDRIRIIPKIENLRSNLGVENKLNDITKKILNFYETEIEIINDVKNTSKINDISSRVAKNPIPVFTDNEIKSIACLPCSKCSTGNYTNPENPGCYKTIDTICIPKQNVKSMKLLQKKVMIKQIDYVDLVNVRKICMVLLNVKWRNFRR